VAEQLLFAGNSVGDVLRAQQERLRSFVQDIDPDVVLSTPTEDLLDRICAKFEIECPVLRHDEWYSPGAKDVKFDVTGDFRRATFGPGPHHVPGTSVSVHVPFDGEKDVFLLRPNPFSMSPPRAVISGQEVIVTVSGPADSLNPDALRKQLEETISQIQIHLDRARTEIGPYNDGLRSNVRGLLERRRSKVLGDRSLEETLGVPVAPRPNRSTTLAVDVPKKRRPVAPLTPRPPGSFRPEPAISRGDFDAIVTVIAAFGAAAERFPSTFRPMREEVLRELLLVVLNNQFGPAVGEMFSRNGKTDIAILEGEGPVFIAECKIWKGEKAFREAIDQLLGYLVWRDTKAALVLFIRHKDVTAVGEKAVAELRSHLRFKRQAPDAGTLPVSAFHHDGDEAREIEIALIPVPIPG
jgi:hypothetical protein